MQGRVWSSGQGGRWLFWPREDRDRPQVTQLSPEAEAPQHPSALRPLPTLHQSTVTWGERNTLILLRHTKAATHTSGFPRGFRCRVGCSKYIMPPFISTLHKSFLSNYCRPSRFPGARQMAGTVMWCCPHRGNRPFPEQLNDGVCQGKSGEQRDLGMGRDGHLSSAQPGTRAMCCSIFQVRRWSSVGKPGS